LLDELAETQLDPLAVHGRQPRPSACRDEEPHRVRADIYDPYAHGRQFSPPHRPDKPRSHPRSPAILADRVGNCDP
jgi:hypothetical protein